ncbi:hypothetical protein FRB90_010725, partial [Tulasnella sp. 427]
MKAVSASNEWSQRFEKLKVDQRQIQLKQDWLGMGGEEQNQYPAFCNWINHIVAFFESPQPSKRDLTFIPLGKKKIPSALGYSGGKVFDGMSPSFKPGVACILQAKGEDLVHRSQVLVPIEFNKEKRMQQPPDLKEVELNLSATNSQYLEVTAPSSKKNKREQSDQENEPSKKKPRPSAIHIQSHKTSIIAHLASPSPSKKSTNDDIQLARYAMETLAVMGDSSHVYGLAVSRPKVILWFFDRCGEVRSTSLDVSDTGKLGFLSFKNVVLGSASKFMIDTSAGVIDADYRGIVFVLLFNHSDQDFKVQVGDRVAQLIIEKIGTPDVPEID